MDLSPNNTEFYIQGSNNNFHFGSDYSSQKSTFASVATLIKTLKVKLSKLDIM